jgi:hypothetical protein
MAMIKDWLEQKFHEWESKQERKQSYYSFAHYLGVGHANLALWMDGSVMPQGEDLQMLADKLGPEIYDAVGIPRPNAQLQRLVAAFPGLPAGLRDRLIGAVWDTDQYLRANHLPPDSVDAKKAAVEIFTRWGIKLTN